VFLGVGGGESGDCGDDFGNLRFLKFGVDGNAQDFRSELMGSGATLSGRGWEVLEAGLLVESERVVDFAADTLIEEVLLEGVTTAGS
jgi:hypothetical protein